MPKSQCEATCHDGATRCAKTDPEHLGNHVSSEGDEWFNERDMSRG